MVLWIFLSGLTAAAIAALIAPLARTRDGDPTGESSEIELYKSQLREIETDRARGLLTGDEAKAAEIEVSRRLLKAAAMAQAAPRSSRVALSSRALTVCVASFATVCALCIYLAAGSPNLPSQPLAARLNAPLDGKNVEAMIARVEQRLRTAPNDGMGWSVIAPVYLRQQRFDDAADAFGKAMALLGETPERLTGYGEALTLANNGVPTPAAKAAFAKALSQKPDLVMAQFWLAAASENDGQTQAARDGYRALLKLSVPPQWRAAIETKIAALDAKISGVPPPPLSAPDAGQQKMIEGMVSQLAERLLRDGGEVEEWMRLARSYAVLGKRDDAKAAINKAREQFAGNAEAMKEIDAAAASLGIKS